MPILPGSLMICNPAGFGFYYLSNPKQKAMSTNEPPTRPSYLAGFGLLRTRLFLLVLLTLGPVFALGIYSNLQQRKTERANVEERIKGLAMVAAASQRNLFSESYNVLTTWAQFPFVVWNTNRISANRQGWNLRLISPIHANFGLIEHDGSLYSNGAKSNAVINLSDRTYFQQTMQSGKFSLGNFQPDPLADEPVVNFGYPVLDTKQQPQRVFFASLKLSALSKNLGDISLPEGGVAWILDPAGNVLARSPDPEKWAGKNLATQSFVQRALSGKEITFEDIGVTGAPRLFAVASVPNAASAKITAVIGVPRASSFAQADSALHRNFFIMIGITALALVGAGFFGQRFIVHPVSAIVTAANRLSHGDLSARTGIEDIASELGQLAHAFDGMAENLEARHKELERAYAEIKKINAELEQRIRARTAQLEASNQELESFSYSVSHDLRAPLRHISGFVGLLGMEPSVSQDEKTMGFLNRISSAASQMGTLVDDLLSFSRMGRSAMSLMNVNLNKVILEAHEEVLKPVTNRAIEWRIGELPEVKADYAMLRQVLVNLLSNAVKYTGPRSPAVIEIGVIPHETEHVIFIRDNGVGFDMKYSHKLFGVFQRMHLAEQFEGTGIGLANVQRIIHRHHGRVWAEAAVNQGATFYFALPKH